MIDKRIQKIEAQLHQASKSDRTTAMRMIKQIKHRRQPLDAKGLHHKLNRIEKLIARSIEARLWRERNRPVPAYNTDLPIYAKADEIIAAIAAHPVVIISGETGSGKTTQIPQFCLAAGRGVEGQIGCTQPRRIAAMTVARRIAEELNQPMGQAAGYKIRFQDRTDRKTFIKIMTDGILLAETQRDSKLAAYDTIIVDEAHERSLNIDFVLGLLKTLVQKRRDLKLIITSATIDTAKFSKAFDNAPVIEVSGRMYPVDTIYWSPSSDDQAQNGLTYLESAAQAADHLLQTKRPGDILIFMPTEQDIRETCELLEGRHHHDVTILPLYARLSAAQQKSVFRRSAGRKIIVATNIAETSITIPGIRYVIDTGLARMSQYMPRSRTTALPVQPVSRSSADQRKGRCGRVSDGVCVRLYSQDDYENRPLFTQPEILRANLAEVILRMIALRLGKIEAFPFIDPPAPQHINDGLDLLYELGAIAPSKKPRKDRIAQSPRLTAEGRLMARLPIDPRLSRMIIEAHRRGCLQDIIIIAAVLSLQDPRERPTEQEQVAEQAQAVFKDRYSDFMTLLNIWHRCHDSLGTPPKTSRLKKFCRTHFLSFKRMREWRDIHHQIVTITREHGLKAETLPLDPATKQPQVKAAQADDPFTPHFNAVHCSVLSGFLSNIAQKKEKNFFRAAKGLEVMIFPGSGLFNRAGEWIVAAEMVETSRLFARTVARIDSNWLEAMGRSQCKYTYLHPHWERKRGEVVALEQVSLFGLIIVPQRPVGYGRINSEEATTIFIETALIQGDLKKPLPFMRFNQELIDDIRAMENRLRRRDLLIDEQTLFQFYAKRLKAVYSVPTLIKIIKERGGDQFLRIKKEDLLQQSPDRDALALFPDRVALGPNTFACEYCFEPGQAQDGLTVNIPIAKAALVDPDAIDWLVPGLYREEITALIKGLPKSFRKHLVPVARTVDLIVAELPYAQGNLLAALSRFVHDRFALDIPTATWPISRLPDHLKMRLALTDQHDQVVRTSREKSSLYATATPRHYSNTIQQAVRTWERNGITAWDFEDLGATVTLKHPGGPPSLFYPGLATDAEGLHLRLFQQPQEALESHLQGIVALFEIRFAKDVRFLKRNLTLPPALAPAARYFGGLQALEKRLYDRVRDNLFRRNLRTRSAFDAHAEAVVRMGGLHQQGQSDTSCLITVLKAYAETRGTLHDLEATNGANRHVLAFLNALRTELTNLVPDNFLKLYDTERLGHLPRYTKAIGIRAQRGAVDLEKDRQRSATVAVFTEELQGFLRSLAPDVSDAKRQAIEALHWMIEEYKISVFAQEIKTNGPISNKRLKAQVKKIERMT